MNDSNFKTPKIQARVQYMHPTLQQIMLDMVDWLSQRGVTPVVTETVTTPEEDKLAGRKSVTHQQGRALDLRTRDWPHHLKVEFEEHFNEKFGSLGALSPSTMKPLLLLFHDIGLGEHYHVQLAHQYAMEIPKDMDKLTA